MGREPEGVFLLDLADPLWEQDPWPAILPEGWWDGFVPSYNPPASSRSLVERASTCMTGMLLGVLFMRDHVGASDDLIQAKARGAVRFQLAKEAWDEPFLPRLWMKNESMVEEHDAATEIALTHPHADPTWLGATAAGEWIKNRAIRLEAKIHAIDPDRYCMPQVVRVLATHDPHALAAHHAYADGTPFGPKCRAAFVRSFRELIAQAILDFPLEEQSGG